MSYAEQADPAGPRCGLKPIARMCHEINRIYCESIGDNSQVHWDEAPEWQRESAMKGVSFALSADVTAEDLHMSWCKEKIKTGWVHGAIKDPKNKKHPCLVPYADLPEEQRFKDKFFQTVVKGMI